MRTLTAQGPGLLQSDEYPPGLFNQITDILADLVLQDIKQYPRIDRVYEPENTVPLIHVGKA